MKKIFVAAMLACLMVFSQAVNADDIYISFSDMGEGPALSNTTNSDLAIGDLSSFFIYVDDTINISTGAFLDIFSDDQNVAALRGAEVFNPGIFVGAVQTNTRWQDTAVDPGELVNDGFIDELRGFSVSEGTGILTSQVTGSTFVDAGHDPTSSAFLFARVDFEIVGEGTANFTLGIGDGLIVDGANELDPKFGAGQVIVEPGNVVPEPTTASLLALGLCGIIARRRR